MNKKIKELKTISLSAGNYNNPTDFIESFNKAINDLIKEGFVPYSGVETTYSSSTFDTNIRSQLGGAKSLTQQFVKYEESNISHIPPTSHDFEVWKKERFCNEIEHLHYHLFYNEKECHAKLTIVPDYFILDIYPLQMSQDIGKGAGQSIQEKFKRTS